MCLIIKESFGQAQIMCMCVAHLLFQKAVTSRLYYRAGLKKKKIKLLDCNKVTWRLLGVGWISQQGVPIDGNTNSTEPYHVENKCYTDVKDFLIHIQKISQCKCTCILVVGVFRSPQKRPGRRFPAPLEISTVQIESTTTQESTAFSLSAASTQ